MATAALLTKQSKSPSLSITYAVLVQSAPMSRQAISTPGHSAARLSRVSCERDTATTFAPHATSFLHNSRPIPEINHLRFQRKNLFSVY